MFACDTPISFPALVFIFSGVGFDFRVILTFDQRFFGSVIHG